MYTIIKRPFIVQAQFHKQAENKASYSSYSSITLPTPICLLSLNHTLIPQTILHKSILIINLTKLVCTNFRRQTYHITYLTKNGNQFFQNFHQTQCRYKLHLYFSYQQPQLHFISHLQHLCI